MSEILDVLVVGGGTVGLGVSYFLKRQGIDHLVLERGRIGESWLALRWDSFRLNSATVRSIMPGDTYDGPDPWGALTHHEFVAYLEAYVRRHRLPIRAHSAVTELVKHNGLFRAATAGGVLLARNVVVATSDQNRLVPPPMAADLPAAIRQIDCLGYRNAAGLEPGAVLVVGSGQSGGQVAEDLVRAGRKVFLATSRTGRIVREYRGSNMLNWLTLCGFLDVPREQVILPSGKAPARALMGATHTITLQSLSAQGVVLLGRLQGVENGRLLFGDELGEHMRFSDEASANLKRIVDDYIRREGLDAPQAEDDPAETVAPRLSDPPIRFLDVAASGIRSVVWCTGVSGDFSWLCIPEALDATGKPVHRHGVTSVPGLYFAGLDFASTRKSGTILAVAEEATRLVERVVNKSAADLQWDGAPAAI